MANKPENLKPFKKGYDPRRRPKQKGDISWKRKFIEDYEKWCKEKGENPRDKMMEFFDVWEIMAKKKFPALQEWINRVYGKQLERIEHSGSIEEIQKADEETKQLIDKSFLWMKKQMKSQMKPKTQK